MSEDKLKEQAMPRRFRAAMYDQGLFVFREICDQLIHCVVSLDGQIDRTIIEKAVRLTLDAEPVFGCRFVDHWCTPYWSRIGNLDDAGLFRLVDTTDVGRELSGFLATPIDPFKGPQVQVRIFRSTTDTLCIKVNHMVADAAGVKDYAYLLASLYRELSRDIKYKPAPNLGSRSLRQVSRHFGIIDKLRIMRRGFRDKKSMGAYWSAIPSANGTYNPVFVFRKISREKFRNLRLYGHRENATLHDMVLAAYYRALFEVINQCPGIPMGLITTADLRRYIPSGKTEAICNCSALVYSNIGMEIGDSFDDTLSRVQNDMNIRKADFLGLGDLPFLAIISRCLPHFLSKRLILRMILTRAKSGHFATALTNMGAIDYEKLDFGDVRVTDAFLTAPLSYYGLTSLLIGLSSFGESIAFSAGFYGSAQDALTVQRLLDFMIREMPG